MLTNQILKLNSSNVRIKVNKENYEQLLREKDAAKKKRGEDGGYGFGFVDIFIGQQVMYHIFLNRTSERLIEKPEEKVEPVNTDDEHYKALCR